MRLNVESKADTALMKEKTAELLNMLKRGIALSPMFSAIHRYRGFIIDSVKRDFQSSVIKRVFGGCMADFTACCHDFPSYADLF